MFKTLSLVFYDNVSTFDEMRVDGGISYSTLLSYKWFRSLNMVNTLVYVWDFKLASKSFDLRPLNYTLMTYAYQSKSFMYSYKNAFIKKIVVTH